MKGATCNFCGKSFRNRQAVRAHLKGCPDYRQMPKATVPSVGSTPGTSGLRDRNPHTQLTPDPGPARDRPRHPTPRIAAGASQKPNITELSRLTIQSVKDQVIDSWWSLNHTIPSEAKAQALVAIEQELSKLLVDQLPRSELVTIAEGIRDQFYQPVIQAQQRARNEEDRKRNQSRQRTILIAAGATHANRSLRQQQDLDGVSRLDLEQKVKRALEQEVDGSESEADVQARVDDLLERELKAIQQERREQARRPLIEHGIAYATRELDWEEDLDAWERSQIQRDVNQALGEEITGEESESDVEALADEILDQVLGETEEEDEEDEEED